MNVIDLEQPKRSYRSVHWSSYQPCGADKAGVTSLVHRLLTRRCRGRDLFEQALKIGYSQPPGQAANEEEAALAARRLASQFLSVHLMLGGRAMEIVENEEDLLVLTCELLLRKSRPQFLDSYIVGQECEVDAISDGKNVLIPGIMEHIERAGVPRVTQWLFTPQTLSQRFGRPSQTTQTLSNRSSLPWNDEHQFVIKDEKLLRSIHIPAITVPFLSKVTNIPMAQATGSFLVKVYQNSCQNGLYPESTRVHIKAPVFSLPN